MSSLASREAGRRRRHRRIRKKVAGHSQRPRMAVFRSHKHLYVQLIDDVAGKTLLGCSTLHSAFKDRNSLGNRAAAEDLGELLAQAAQEKGISQVVFDRGGYTYHGRVKALAEAARKGGLTF